MQYLVLYFYFYIFIQCLSQLNSAKIFIYLLQALITDLLKNKQTNEKHVNFLVTAKPTKNLFFLSVFFSDWLYIATFSL